MPLTNTQRMVLTGIGLGIVIGAAMGLIGAYFNLPAGVRGGITGMLIVFLFMVLRKQQGQKS